MNNELKTYYIPINPNIKTGSIYTLYINNNTNLDLTSIFSTKNSISNITLEMNEYNKLINLNQQITKIINNNSNKIENFIQDEKQIINELANLNIEYNNTIKNINIKGGING